MTVEHGLSPHGTARERFSRSASSPIPDDARSAAAGFDLGSELLYLAWELASYADDIDAADRRALFFVILAVLAAQRDGSTRVPVGDRAVFDEVLQSVGATADDRTRAAALIAHPARSGGIIGGAGDHRPLLVDGEHLYSQRMLALEERLAGGLAPRLARTDRAHDVGDAVAAVVTDPVSLSGEQEQAIRAALSSALTVVTGGPGTGKTSIVVAILRALVRLGVPVEAVALAAPTGKAANRMAQSIESSLLAIDDRDEHDEGLLRTCPEPQTLHRLLGYSPGADRFRHHRNNPLSQQVVIVDEGSMIDVVLMERLVQAVRPDARLVLLGDADQLPSVEAGAVFRDLVAAGTAVRLTHSYRVQGDWLERATVVPPRQRDAFLDRWFDERIRFDGYADLVRKEYRYGRDGFGDADVADLHTLFEHLGRARVLAVTRDTRGTGASAINARFHRRVLEELGGGIHGATAFFPGEPVMMLRNDYDRRLFNGDQGIVLRVAQGEGRHHFMAVFPRKDDFAVFHIDALRAHLQLAFAMTVHKAQGSEFDHIALVLPERDIPLASRELVYTALTRSRDTATVVGDAAILRAAVARHVRRYSGLQHRLSAVPSPLPGEGGGA